MCKTDFKSPSHIKSSNYGDEMVRSFKLTATQKGLVGPYTFQYSQTPPSRLGFVHDMCKGGLQRTQR